MACRPRFVRRASRRWRAPRPLAPGRTGAPSWLPPSLTISTFRVPNAAAPGAGAGAVCRKSSSWSPRPGGDVQASAGVGRADRISLPPTAPRPQMMTSDPVQTAVRFVTRRRGTERRRRGPRVRLGVVHRAVVPMDALAHDGTAPHHEARAGPVPEEPRACGRRAGRGMVATGSITSPGCQRAPSPKVALPVQGVVAAPHDHLGPGPSHACRRPGARRSGRCGRRPRIGDRVVNAAPGTV